MKVLLDTHTLLWALMQPEKLSVSARQVIQDRSNDVVVSAASAWEIATKHRLGKLDGASAVVEGYPQQLQELGARELAITSRHALLAGRFAVAHRDPFDRMLAAQGLIEGVAVVTADPAFALFEVATLW